MFPNFIATKPTLACHFLNSGNFIQLLGISQEDVRENFFTTCFLIRALLSFTLHGVPPSFMINYRFPSIGTN